jgi:hypothetical protein
LPLKFNPVAWLTGPRPSHEGQSWSNRELVEHLQKCGMQFKAIAVPVNDPRLESALLLVRDQSKEEFGNAVVQSALRVWGGNNVVPDVNKLFEGTGLIVIMKYQSAEAAREDVRKAHDEQLINADILFAWGRFAFVGDSVLILQVRKGLL